MESGSWSDHLPSQATDRLFKVSPSPSNDTILEERHSAASTSTDNEEAGDVTAPLWQDNDRLS